MKNNTICILSAAAVLSALISGCAADKTEDSISIEPEHNDPIIETHDEYAQTDGFITYNSADGAFSIQLPEGCSVDDSDAENATITLLSDYDTPDLINISKSENTAQLNSLTELMTQLSNDNSIDITSFYVLNKNNDYEGYKYTYSSVDNPDLKGIVSTYFSDDGSAYIVNASISNGGDDENVSLINSVVDSFVNHL